MEESVRKTESSNTKSQYRAIKRRFCNILISSKRFCCLCFDSDAELLSIDDYVTTDWDSAFLPTWRYIWSAIFVPNMNFLSNYLCSTCKDKSYSAYSLIISTQKAMSCLEDFVQQINSQINNIKDADLDGCPNTCLILKEPNFHNPTEVKVEENLHQYEELIDNNIDHERHNETEVQKGNDEMLEEHEEVFTIFEILPKDEKILSKKRRTKKLRKPKKKGKIPTKDSDYDFYTEIEYLDEDLFKEDNNKTNTEIKDDITVKTHQKKLKDDVKIEIDIHENSKSKKKIKSSNLTVGQKPLGVVKGKLRKNNVEIKTEPSENSKGVYFCDYCGKRFNSRHNIILHLKQNHDISKPKLRTKYTCCECDEEPCRHEKYIKAYHSQVLADKKTIECPDCDFRCIKMSTLVGHANKKHLKHVSFTCEFCNMLLHSKDAYDNHISYFHTKLFSCKMCDKKFKLEHRKISHERECEREKVKWEFKCDECPAAFQTEKKLKYHKIRHVQQFPCDLCERVFSMRTLLAQHLTWHKQGGLARKCTFACPCCGKVFKTRKERDNHMNDHGPDEPYKCFVCNVELKTFKEFGLHMNKFTHLRRVNPGKTHKHKCEYCNNYSTTRRVHLEAHINRHHLKITPYSCTKCRKKFLSSYLLEKHEETHKEKPDELRNRFPCEICGKRFVSGVNAKVHMRQHTGEKPFQCEICGDRFVTASRRKVHIDTTHKDRDIFCPLCDFAGSIIPQLRSHIKNFHWDKKSGKQFDHRKVVGLTPEHYYLFTDNRFIHHKLK
ncbi:hypothetical protein JYU34_022423 [Plutella xylostella]|uniref:C2H2-type domain-containing protein n=1 Tax=Plutella xylostella TaxID=51655 RepID=A0ABQ7PR47_PLUXY|nr:hypothetical protein JYU34_022423 [Plutella xylostella]